MVKKWFFWTLFWTHFKGQFVDMTTDIFQNKNKKNIFYFFNFFSKIFEKFLKKIWTKNFFLKKNFFIFFFWKIKVVNLWTWPLNMELTISLFFPKMTKKWCFLTPFLGHFLVIFDPFLAIFWPIFDPLFDNSRPIFDPPFLTFLRASPINFNLFSNTFFFETKSVSLFNHFLKFLFLSRCFWTLKHESPIAKFQLFFNFLSNLTFWSHFLEKNDTFFWKFFQEVFKKVKSSWVKMNEMSRRVARILDPLRPQKSFSKWKHLRVHQGQISLFLNSTKFFFKKKFTFLSRLESASLFFQNLDFFQFFKKGQKSGQKVGHFCHFRGSTFFGQNWPILAKFWPNLDPLGSHTRQNDTFSHQNWHFCKFFSFFVIFSIFVNFVIFKKHQNLWFVIHILMCRSIFAANRY